MTNATSLFEDQGELERLLVLYRDMKVEAAYYIEVLKNLEKRIRAHVKETGEIAEIDGARIVVRPSKPRIKWDMEGLDGFAKTNPEILKFRSEVNYSPSVLIQVD